MPTQLGAPPVRLKVPSAPYFTGRTFYETEVLFSNDSPTPVVVDRVELATRDGEYDHVPERPGEYPITVGPGATGRLPAVFNLTHSVETTFEDEVQLRVYYQSGGSQWLSYATLRVEQLSDRREDTGAPPN
jgi:hypothetical protein